MLDRSGKEAARVSRDMCCLGAEVEILSLWSLCACSMDVQDFPVVRWPSQYQIQIALSWQRQEGEDGAAFVRGNITIY